MEAIRHWAANGKQIANISTIIIHDLMQFWRRYVSLLQTPFVVSTAPRALDFSILRTAVALCIAQWDAMGHPCWALPLQQVLPTSNSHQHQHQSTSTYNKSAQQPATRYEKEPLPLILAVMSLLEHPHPLQFQPERRRIYHLTLVGFSR